MDRKIKETVLIILCLLIFIMFEAGLIAIAANPDSFLENYHMDDAISSATPAISMEGSEDMLLFEEDTEAREP